MPSSHLALAATLAATLSACTPGRALMVGGGALTVGGVVGLNNANNNRDCVAADGSDCWVVQDAFHQVGNDMEREVSKIMIGAGILMVVAGLIVEAKRDSEPTEATIVARYQPPVAHAGPPGASAITAETAPYMQAPVAAAAPVASPAMLALRTKTENRLALQASTAAARGDCTAARASTTALATRDQQLVSELLARDPAVATCVALAPQRM